MQTFLDAALAAAREAGALIRDRLGRYEALDTKLNAKDLVTDVDRACEVLIAQRLLTAFPDHKILGEEAVAEQANRLDREADPAQAEWLWVCDPIDGTTNFVHSFPACVVSIALAHWGVPVLGVIYDPSRDEAFWATRGGGAFLNGAALRVRTEATLSEALLSTGFPVTEPERSAGVADLARVLPACRGMRALGSAALQLAYVASGRLTGWWGRTLKAWDVAAGYVLVTEAGGQLTDLDGTPYTLFTSAMVASNGLVHDALRELLGADPG